MTWPSWPSWSMISMSDMVYDVSVWWHDCHGPWCQCLTWPPCLHLVWSWRGSVCAGLGDTPTLQHSTLHTTHYTLHTPPMLQSPSGPRLGDTQLTRSSRASNIIFSTSFCRKCKAIQWIAKNNFHWKYFNNFFFMEIKCLLLLKHMKFWPNLEFSEFYITS